MADWWMQSGTTSSSMTGAPVIAGTTGEWGLSAASIDGSMIKSCTITQENLGRGVVYSENASLNLALRSVVIPIPINPAAGADYGSTGLPLWTPGRPVTTYYVWLHPYGAWSLTTCGEEIHLWTTGAQTVAQYCTSSTALCLTTTGSYRFTQAGVNLTCGETVYLGLVNLAACSDVGLGAIQIDYWSTG